MRLHRANTALWDFLNAISLNGLSEIAHFNLACIYSLQKKKEEALNSLTKAIENGYNNAQQLLNDRDLDNIKDMPEFGELVKRCR